MERSHDQNISKKLVIGEDPEGHRVTLELEIGHKGPEKTTTGEIIKRKTVDMQEVTEYDTLSICGTSRNGGGQINGIIRKELDDYKKLYIPEESIVRILDIWDTYHLNNLNPGTRLQAEALAKHYAEHPEQTRDYTNDCRVLDGIPAGEYAIEFLAEIRRIPSNLQGEYPAEGYHKPKYKATGEFREPMKGEYYLSGAEIAAYRAPNDLRAKYYIARPADKVQPLGSGEVWLLLPASRLWFYQNKADAETRAKEFTETTKKQTRVIPTGTLLTDRGYKYGSAWLVDALPDEIKAEITALFDASEQPSAPEADSLEAFISRHGITFECHRVDKRPDKLMDGTGSDFSKGGNDMRHFKCRITALPDQRRRSFGLYFSQGSAHTEDPELTEVLSCLADDASTYENAQSFEDWASELGYETDSRKAEKIYKAVKRQAEQLKRTLGQAAYHELLWETERL